MLLQVRNLKTHFRVAGNKIAKAVDGVSFELRQGKTLALVGESGCGKTQTAFSLMRLLAENGYHPDGEILFDGKNLAHCDAEEMQHIRGDRMAMIFQEPMTSLNPLYRIGNQLEEPLRLHRRMQKGPARERAIALLARVGIPAPEKRIDDFPHQLSGGMKQRVMIAMALACEPKLLIADEPTTALDVTIQAQVLRLMADLQSETGMSILLITHDLGIVNQMADDICIMYAGRVVEQGSREQIFRHMAHPYTRRLFASIPKPEDTAYYLNTIPGRVPPATEYGAGCLFYDRCPQAMEHCRRDDSVLHDLAETGHTARCHLFAEIKTAAELPIEEKKPAPIRLAKDRILVRIENLKTHFPLHKGVLKRVVGHIKAVDDVTLNLPEGSTLALVGESGCGKTTLGESILRLNREAEGKVLFRGIDLLRLNNKELKKTRRHLQIIFQDPFGSLSPRMTVEEIVGEGIRVHHPDISPQQKRKQVSDVLHEVGLDPSSMERYPHEFSGGQRQRISIARALILEPELLVLDEPTSALDVSVQAQVINLLRELQARRRLTYLFITHNLAVVEYVADAVAIMYLGRIVEQGPVRDLFRRPRHPYTQSLLAAVPSLGERKPFRSLMGDVPSPLHPPSGCHFHPRCPVFQNEPEGSPLRTNCKSHYPELKSEGDCAVACHSDQS
jgi:peptide/nickel transport system ATP-binding protein